MVFSSKFEISKHNKHKIPCLFIKNKLF
jgi:hypothetical protein